MTQNSLHGWLLLDKPLGITSAHAVAKVKRHLKPGKIGHGGTLDPLASGLLPLALGEATKTFNYFVAQRKSYQFSVTWGQERSTDDAEGEVIAQSDNRPEIDDITALLADFTGTIQQRPPSFSAISIGGQRAYKAARGGELLQLPDRAVEVYSLTMCGHHGNTTDFEVTCGKGTYVRSLARDMGCQLGCYGYVSALRRTSVGPFRISEAIGLDLLEQMDYQTLLLSYLKPVDYALDDIPAVTVGEEAAQRLQTGRLAQPLPNQDLPHGAILCTCAERLIGFVEWDGIRLKPLRLFNL